MTNPIATYRLQFNGSFTFKDFEKLIPYFVRLGVSTIYASPVLASVKGSTHGYDGINPDVLSPEIGTIEHLTTLSNQLGEAGIGWLQDIVPNHMAFDPSNPWLFDVLEKGHESPYRGFFDAGLTSGFFAGKLMVPFLGDDLEKVIENGQLKLKFIEGNLTLHYEGTDFPAAIETYRQILEKEAEKAPQSVKQLAEQIRALKDTEDANVYHERWNEIILQLAALQKDETTAAFFDNVITKINGDPARIREIADGQNYKLCNWRDTEKEINYRRFFTVNGLICLNMQDQQVFDRYHKLVAELTASGVFSGLRIDHVDGLYDPAGYLEKLRELAGPEKYIVVEKILEKTEDLPDNWPVQGATGYEFLGVVNNLFTNQASEKAFTDFYQKLTGNEKSVREQLLSSKSAILHGHMGGELDNLTRLFSKLLQSAGAGQEADTFRDVIAEFLIHCPVYRFYGNQMPLSPEEAEQVKLVLADVKKSHPELAEKAEILEECLLEKTTQNDPAYNALSLKFYQRLMQFCGPLMAKGGEDTLMYTYNRFIGHNEVGDFPDRFGVSVKEFHHYMKKRQKHWPLAQNTTSTHDTKRGEDVRARLNVLTDLGETWFKKVEKWRSENAVDAPDANDQYLILQNMIGAYPMPGTGEDSFTERFGEYLQKALREAKVHSDWADPNKEYEDKAQTFAKDLLKAGTDFQTDFQEFLSQIADFGIINSLAQVALKFTCPGIPDVYQGCEWWDLSLVDPDNRRPVDYAARMEMLSHFDDYEPERLAEKLWEERYTGGIKLWLTQQLFELRKDHPTLFASGEYIPLKVRGEYKDHILAFARKEKRDFCIVAVPLHAALICNEQQTEFFNIDWKDTSISIPEHLSEEWQSILISQTQTHQNKIPAADLFTIFPLAILKGSRLENPRTSGVLLHITSLASPFGIGDLGHEAFAFADFLAKGKQRLWQILPLNPTEAAQTHSPYSALSSRAGNPLMISPEVLVQEGLLTSEIIEKYQVSSTGKVDFEEASAIKKDLLERAFEKYQELDDHEKAEAFEAFTEKNREWLDDFSVYMLLKNRFEAQPWYEWPEEYRKREPNAMEALHKENAREILFNKWQQYEFDRQWKSLKRYCNDLEIKFLGDIPFYVSYDSADVWSHKSLFCVNGDGKITGVAGVPPDAFSEDGQLWGMPVFDWSEMEKQDYRWWIDRLAKNVELFDVVRLDHFRAFADFWEVPGGEKTAVNGKWKTGPGAAFFRKVASALGMLPFVAEDLGEITPEVYQLRDEFKLPGMKVLQFAFDEHMAQSDHIPHHFSANFYAYTGTHDNNTTRGWFKDIEAGGGHERVSDYLGREVDEENVNQELARVLFASVADTVVMPVQDVLNLDESAKMNLPGSNENNWLWRLQPGQIEDSHAEFLEKLTLLYHRD